MATERQPERIVPIREQRTIKCHDCGNDNLVHGLTLAKATSIMMIGGPGQAPQLVGDNWAIYMCIGCESFFPYPKTYATQSGLQQKHKQILDWCVSQAELRKQRNEHLRTMTSIIEANKDLLGLPGQREDNMEKTLAPLIDRIDELESRFISKKGGRPKHCKVLECKVKAETDGLCAPHFLERKHV